MSTDGDAVLEQVDGHLKRNIFLHIDDRIRILKIQLSFIYYIAGKFPLKKVNSITLKQINFIWAYWEQLRC